MAELADAQASGACGRKIVWVQVPSPASLKYDKYSREVMFIVFLLYANIGEMMMKKKPQSIELLKETVILTAAVAIIAAAVYFFLVPSHASVSSISGLGIVLANFVPLPLSAITMILNVVL